MRGSTDVKFGARVAEVRQALGLKQADLAAHLDVTVQTIKNWENGRSSMSTDRLAEIAAIFKMTVHVLLKPNGSPIPGRKRMKRWKEILPRIAKRRSRLTAIPFLLIAAL